MTTLIVDYGLCNLDSVHRAVERCGGAPKVSDDPRELRTASRIILPGVGSFADAARRLSAQGWVEAIRAEVAAGIPLLGICLGMQLLATEGEEGGVSAGLDLVPGRVIRLCASSPAERIPHVGWNEVHRRRESPLFSGVPDARDFYFVHSYHFVTRNDEDVLATTPGYGQVVSVVQRGKVFGTQFHPEKSQRLGLAVLSNFVAM